MCSRLDLDPSGGSEGPTSRLTFLGIEIDTDALVLRLSDEKLIMGRPPLAPQTGGTITRW